MTNADVIRRMTDDELYEFLSEWECGDIDYAVTFCDLCKGGGNELNIDCDGCRKHWLTRNAVEYGGLFYWKRNKDFTDRKTEPSDSEKPNNSTCSKMEQVDKDTNVRSKPNDCKYAVNPSGDVWECGCCLEIFCEYQIYDRNPDGTLNIVKCGFEPKTEPQAITCPLQEEDADYARWLYEGEPQTDIEIARAIVHKAIDDTPIAEDAYPDLRQKMHDAVDNYEPQTDCAWKKGE